MYTHTGKQDKRIHLHLLLQLILSGSPTFPEDSFLGPDVCLQLCSSDVDADGLWQVADSLGNHGFGCVTGLQPGCLQPHILTLEREMLPSTGGQIPFSPFQLSYTVLCHLTKQLANQTERSGVFFVFDVVGMSLWSG